MLVHPFGYNYEETEKLKLEDLSLVYDKDTHRIYFDSEQHGKARSVLFWFFIADISAQVTEDSKPIIQSGYLELCSL